MKTYETPNLEVLRLSSLDVILTSAGTDTPYIEIPSDEDGMNGLIG